MQVGFNAFANTNLVQFIMSVEGHAPICAPDNRQISGGYGSNKLCTECKYEKQNNKVVKVCINLVGKKISKKEAEKQLQLEHLEYKKEVNNALHILNVRHNIKQYYPQHQINSLTIANYNKGQTQMSNLNMFKMALLYNQKKISEKEVMLAFARLSCLNDAKTNQYKFSLGLFSRHYATSQLFLNKVRDLKHFEQLKDNAKNLHNLKNYAKSFCENKRV